MNRTVNMTRDEFNKYVARKDPAPCKCELDDCPYKDAARWHKLDCLDCDHWVEVEDD